MQKLSLREIQLQELELLKRFDIFCKKTNLRYYLMGGTLLGAIRHKGFIPWDDDIDVCMPRPDYEAFVKTFRDEDRPNLELRSNLLGNFDAPFTKLVDLTTKVNSKYSHFDTNLWIDIFPVDGLPEDIQQFERLWKTRRLYKRILVLTESKLGEGTTPFSKYGKYVLKPLARLYGKQRCINKIEHLAAQYPYGKCKYVGEYAWSDSRVSMLKPAFEKAVEVDFEGYRFPAFSCWDSFLKSTFGSHYMELPPVKDRQGHDIEAYIERKFSGQSSSKIGRASGSLKKEDFELPDEWLKIIKRTDGTRKKIIFYNTSLYAFINHNEEALIKMESVFKFFKEYKDEAALWWRPHPLMETTIKSMRPRLWENYKKLRDTYVNENWGIYDDSADLDRAVVLSDAYYGDGSRAVELFKTRGIPVMIQNPAILI